MNIKEQPKGIYMEIPEFIKCTGCNCMRGVDEYEMYKGNRRLTCLFCKNKRINSRCEHDKYKSCCKICGGSRLCQHDKDKYKCIECKGSQVCLHGRERCKCIECGGASTCEHLKRRRACKICNHHLCLLNCQRTKIKGLLKSKSSLETEVEYLGCNIEHFKTFIEKKFQEGMNWDNIQLDHIKPITKFHLDNPEEFRKCAHYSNFQPLTSQQNKRKYNNWMEVDETFWNENIYGKEYEDLYLTV